MEIRIDNEELIKQSLFDKEKIKSIYDRYVDKIIPFDKQCFKCFVKRNKRYFFNFNEGAKYSDEEFNDLHLLSGTYIITGSYWGMGQNAIYDEETDYLIFIEKTIKDAETLEKKEGYSIEEFYIMNRYKSVCKVKDGKAFIVCPESYDYRINKSKENCEAIKNYFGTYVLIKGNQPYVLGYEYSIDYFLKHKEVLRKEGPKQKLIDELGKTKVEFINRKPSKFITKKINYKEDKPIPAIGYSCSDHQCFAKADLQMLDNGYLLLRGYYEFVDKKNNTEIIEAIRFYYKDGKCIKARRCIDNTFITAQGIKPEHCQFRVELENISEKVYEETNLKYMKEIIENTPASNRMYFIYQLLNNPDIEKLYKIGFKDLVLCLSKSTDDSKDVIYTFLGTAIQDKKKNILAKYGMNSYQSDKFVNYLSNKVKDSHHKIYQEKIIYYMRRAINDLSPLDNETFDKYLNLQIKIFQTSSVSTYSSILSKLSKEKGLSYALDKVEKLMEIEKPSGFGYQTPERLYLDIIRMSTQSRNNVPDNVYKFTTYEDIVSTHDNLVYIVNKRKNEILNSSFEELQTKWKRYLYEDEEYLIIAPEKASDLAKEGLELHHCVKSYIEAVAEGRTNILFLRKKIDPDKPFFTIEITNDNQIRQIHGFANCNITTDGNANKFYNKWLKAKKIKNYVKNGAYCVGD